MPLTQASLATKIQAEIIAQFGAANDAGTLNKFAQAVAKAVVDEIHANAVVNVTTPNAQGGAATLPGTGTVT